VTVSVDDMRATYGRMVMCHMLADFELDAMVSGIGVAMRWRQCPERTDGILCKTSRFRSCTLLKNQFGHGDTRRVSADPAGMFKQLVRLRDLRRPSTENVVKSHGRLISVNAGAHDLDLAMNDSKDPDRSSDGMRATESKWYQCRQIADWDIEFGFLKKCRNPRPVYANALSRILPVIEKTHCSLECRQRAVNPWQNPGCYKTRAHIDFSASEPLLPKSQPKCHAYCAAGTKSSRYIPDVFSGTELPGGDKPDSPQSEEQQSDQQCNKGHVYDFPALFHINPGNILKRIVA
jgi:hypothetical protein